MLNKLIYHKIRLYTLHTHVYPWNPLYTPAHPCIIAYPLNIECCDNSQNRYLTKRSNVKSLEKTQAFAHCCVKQAFHGLSLVTSFV